MNKNIIGYLNGLAPEGLALFPEDQYTVQAGIGGNPVALLLRSYELDMAEIPDSVEAIGRAGAGTNNIPVAECAKRGIPVYNAPGANANAVAELTLGLMKMAARNIGPAWDFTGEVLESGEHNRIESEKKQFVGTELRGKTVAVIGLGAIGILVADYCVGNKMKVIGYDAAPLTVARRALLSESVERVQYIRDAVSRADFVTLHIPSSKENVCIVNAELLNDFRHGTILINTARKCLVDERALIEALESGILRAYATDFPTFKHPRVVNMPHIGASTEEAELNCALMVCEQVREYLENGNIVNAVNMVDTVLERAGGTRFTFWHKNMPGMIANITTGFARQGLNIIDQLNRSKGEYAYTIVDVEPEFELDHASLILRDMQRDMDGIIKARAL